METINSEIIEQKLTLKDKDVIENFGIKLQTDVGNSSSEILTKFKTGQLDNEGNEINKLLQILKENEVSNITNKNENFLTKLFNKGKNEVNHLIEKQTTIEEQVSRIVETLKNDQKELSNNTQLVQEEIERTKEYVKSIQEHVKFGKEQVKLLRDNDLSKLELETSKNPTNTLAIQELREANYLVEKFEKRIYDLELAESMLSQQFPMYNMMVETNKILSEKIDSTISFSVPLWKQGLSMYVALQQQAKAVKTAEAVQDFTNKMIVKNAQMLKDNTVQAVQQSNKGIINIDSLEQAHSLILSTLTEVIDIQKNARQERLENTKKLEELTKKFQEQLLLTSSKNENLIQTEKYLLP